MVRFELIRVPHGSHHKWTDVHNDEDKICLHDVISATLCETISLPPGSATKVMLPFPVGLPPRQSWRFRNNFVESRSIHQYLYHRIREYRRNLFLERHALSGESVWTCHGMQRRSSGTTRSGDLRDSCVTAEDSTCVTEALKVGAPRAYFAGSLTTTHHWPCCCIMRWDHFGNRSAGQLINVHIPCSA